MAQRLHNKMHEKKDNLAFIPNGIMALWQGKRIFLFAINSV